MKEFKDLTFWIQDPNNTNQTWDTEPLIVQRTHPLNTNAQTPHTQILEHRLLRDFRDLTCWIWADQINQTQPLGKRPGKSSETSYSGHGPPIASNLNPEVQNSNENSYPNQSTLYT